MLGSHRVRASCRIGHVVFVLATAWCAPAGVRAQGDDSTRQAHQVIGIADVAAEIDADSDDVQRWLRAAITGPRRAALNDRKAEFDNQISDQHVTNARNAFDTILFGPQHADAIRTRLDRLLAIKIDAIEKIYGLTGAQRRKLELAGRGDIKRLFDRVESCREDFPRQTQEGDVGRELANEICRLRSGVDRGSLDDGSLFNKTLRNVLTPEQASRFPTSKAADKRTDPRPPARPRDEFVAILHRFLVESARRFVNIFCIGPVAESSFAATLLSSSRLHNQGWRPARSAG